VALTQIDSKRALRAEMLARRQTLGAETRRAAAEKLRDVFLREVPIELPVIVSGFWPIQEEIDVRPLMHALSDRGCRLALPVVQGRGKRLLFRAWRPGEPLETGVFGTLQPLASSETVEPDTLLVPMLACDGEGWRVGYGGGFYDRTLADLRSRRSVTAIGVGFDLQLVAEVPHGADDQRLDWLLTERRACAFV
jgi:5-formyltetrahydrofolate cyclo-ligase